jgi:ABC-type nickel/cobalt efflux system permease component RcnA
MQELKDYIGKQEAQIQPLMGELNLSKDLQKKQNAALEKLQTENYRLNEALEALRRRSRSVVHTHTHTHTHTVLTLSLAHTHTHTHTHAHTHTGETRGGGSTRWRNTGIGVFTPASGAGQRGHAKHGG